MAHEPDPTTSLFEQASYWWHVFREGDASAAEHLEFSEWVARSPERVGAYIDAALLHKALKDPAVRWPVISHEELIRDALAAPNEPVRLPHQVSPARNDRSSSGTTSRVRFAFAFAAVVAVVGMSIALAMYQRPEQYMSEFGEQRSVTLGDGTRVTLNTASEIEVRMRKDHRRVRLVQGEALFDVAHDPTRPFDVSAGSAEVRAVGTQLNVDTRPQQTTITVVEGRVAFISGQAPVLVAGDRLVVSASGKALVSHDVNVDAALAWTRHELLFENRPLGEVADEFNRYNRARITIEGASLRSQEVTGVFKSNNPASFISFLSNIPDVAIRSDGMGGHIISEAPQ